MPRPASSEPAASPARHGEEAVSGQTVAATMTSSVPANPSATSACRARLNCHIYASSCTRVVFERAKASM